MIILISAIILLGIVTYYFHRRDLKKQVEKTNKRNRPRQLYTRTNRTLSGNFLYATTGRCAGVGTQFAITANRRPRFTARRNIARCQ